MLLQFCGIRALQSPLLDKKKKGGAARYRGARNGGTTNDAGNSDPRTGAKAGRGKTKKPKCHPNVPIDENKG